MSAHRVAPIVVIVLLAAVVGVGAWQVLETPGDLVNEQPPRLGRTPSPGTEIVTVSVEEGESAREIAEKLEEAGVIQSARLFRVLAALMALEDSLKAGDYEFERGETAASAVRRISQGLTSSMVVTIPEGLRLEEIAELLERRGVISANEFLRAQGDVYTASFLEKLPPNVGLEGYLFPATYGFSRKAGGHEVVQRLLDAFDQRFVEEILPRLTAGGGSLHETIALAAIIEREAGAPDDRPLIGSVFANRLEQGWPLQADPTIQYALGSDPASARRFGYWKRDLTAADLNTDSPYNTYENLGLPPGPIANPGVDSILAALEPADTNYLFFFTRPDGVTLFAETLEDHRRNVCESDPSRPECG